MQERERRWYADHSVDICDGEGVCQNLPCIGCRHVCQNRPCIGCSAEILTLSENVLLSSFNLDDFDKEVVKRTVAGIVRSKKTIPTLANIGIELIMF